MKNFKLGAASGRDSRKQDSAGQGGARGGGRSGPSSGLRTSVARPASARSTSARQSARGGARRGGSTSGGRDRRAGRPVHPPTPLDEMAGLALVAVAIGLGVLAWHPEWMGSLEPWGRWMQDQLGAGRYAVVGFLVLIGLEAFYPHQALGVPLLTVSLAVLWACMEVLADLMGGQGGHVGRLLGGGLAGAVGRPGAWIVALTTAIIDLQWITRVSLRGPARILGLPVRWLVRLVRLLGRGLQAAGAAAADHWARSRAGRDDESGDRWPPYCDASDGRGAAQGDGRRLKVVGEKNAPPAEAPSAATASARSRRGAAGEERPPSTAAEATSGKGRRAADLGAESPVFPEYPHAGGEDEEATDVVAAAEVPPEEESPRGRPASRARKKTESPSFAGSEVEGIFDGVDDLEIPGYEDGPPDSDEYEFDETEAVVVPAVAPAVRVGSPRARTGGKATVDVPPWEDGDEAIVEDAGVDGGEASEGVLELWDEEAQAVTPPSPPREPVEYTLPAMDLLEVPGPSAADSGADYSRVIVETLNSFGVATRIVNVEKGPTVTRYELQPARGVKVSKITSLNNDIALALAAQSIRIEAPIPGKSAIGIEVPNSKVEAVRLREILESAAFTHGRGLMLALGKDISGRPVVADLLRMPHLLIAGATGSGKSVCLNTVIVSILYRSTPQEVQMVMVDPKRVELSIFEGIPHLANTHSNPQSRIVKDAKTGTLVLKQATEIMNQRFELLSRSRVRNIAEYNAKAAVPMPYLVIIVDELAQLMQISARSVEGYLQELAQMGRAAGIHLILATQRPSVDVLTGTIKSNFPARVAFAVSAQVDSRTILDRGGAEKLLGRGDMLFSPTDSELRRVQGALITLEETERVVDYWRTQECPDNLVPLSLEAKAPEDALGQGDGDDEDLLREAVRVIRETKLASASNLQRKLQVGYPRAARLVDELEQRGFLGPANGSKPRKILFLED